MAGQSRTYNPLDYENLGHSVVDAVLARLVVPLIDLTPFDGAGIYAIYYTGPFPAYATLADRNQQERFEAPIYVGKAVPSGARKGGGRGQGARNQALFRRLAEHAGSIAQAVNLELEDFYCRYLIVDDIWIPLGESLIIERFQPIWNVVVDGFGNHDPGSGRYSGQRPMWDVLHPGRPWAERLRENRRSEEDILRLVSAASAGQPIETLSEEARLAEANSDEV